MFIILVTTTISSTTSPVFTLFKLIVVSMTFLKNHNLMMGTLGLNMDSYERTHITKTI